MENIDGKVLSILKEACMCVEPLLKSMQEAATNSGNSDFSIAKCNTKIMEKLNDLSNNEKANIYLYYNEYMENLKYDDDISLFSTIVVSEFLKIVPKYKVVSSTGIVKQNLSSDEALELLAKEPNVNKDNIHDIGNSKYTYSENYMISDDLFLLGYMTAEDIHLKCPYVSLRKNPIKVGHFYIVKYIIIR